VGAPVVHWIRARYGECDMQGVVFNAHYLAYCDENMTELWRVAFGGYTTMLDRGVDMVVAEARLSFHAAARFDQDLALEVGVRRMGTTSLLTAHRIRHANTPLVSAELRHVIVDQATLVKTPIPEWMRSGLEPFVVGER
jgi:acyl-CoA thioester hydrolase